MRLNRHTLCCSSVSSTSERKILEKLLVDESEVLLRLVEKSEKLFKIDRKSGEIIFVCKPKDLSDREKIAVVLLARSFASTLGLAKSQGLKNAELADRLGLPEKSVRARISELKDLRMVDSSSAGEHHIMQANAEVLLDDVLKKVERPKGQKQ
jgi:predicted transcriptional regulator